MLRIEMVLRRPSLVLAIASRFQDRNHFPAAKNQNHLLPAADNPVPPQQGSDLFRQPGARLTRCLPVKLKPLRQSLLCVPSPPHMAPLCSSHPFASDEAATKEYERACENRTRAGRSRHSLTGRAGGLPKGLDRLQEATGGSGPRMISHFPEKERGDRSMQQKSGGKASRNARRVRRSRPGGTPPALCRAPASRGKARP